MKNAITMNQIIKLAAIVLITNILFIGFSKHEQPESQSLIPMMQQLLADMQMVDKGIYMEQYALVEKGAGDIANHPSMTQRDKQIIKKTLGKQMQQFVAFDMTVHHHADSIRIAAVQENMKKILRHYRIVQQGCVNCHSNYRKKISEARKSSN